MTPNGPASDRYDVDSYFGLVNEGALQPDDRVELLEGVVVSMAPQSPEHASATNRIDRTLREAVGRRAVVRVQCPLLAGRYSIPEPDVAVVPGKEPDYDHEHPREALLVVEVADSSLAQDRLTKARIYAAAGVAEYWLVNLRDDVVEVLWAPDAPARRYGERRLAARGDRLALVALPQVSVAVDDLLPDRRA